MSPSILEIEVVSVLRDWVTDDDHLVHHFEILLHRHVDRRAFADGLLDVLIAQIKELQHRRLTVDTQRIAPVVVGGNALVGSGPHDRNARQRIARPVAHDARNRDRRRGGGGGYRGPAGREHHAVTLDTCPQPLRRERAVDDGDDLLVHRPDAHTRREIDLRIVVSERVIAPFLDFGEELLHRDVLHVDRNFAVLRRRRNR